MEIYIKPEKKIKTNKTELLLSDVAEVFSADAGAESVKILDIPPKAKASLLVSATDIVRALKTRYPQALVINLGESDVLVEFARKKRRDGRLLSFLKVVFVTVVLFAGSATAIMSFYTDAQMSKVFENMHRIITGERTENPALIEIPFCFGLAAGIIVFFNHVGGKKFSAEPSPMEIEMSSYEGEVTDTMISALAAEKKDG